MCNEQYSGKVLVSGCLLGNEVRYNGRSLSVSDAILEQWKKDGRIISICPEVDAGMSIPREAAEIVQGDGQGVWRGTASVVEKSGNDVTSLFVNGARLALETCRQHAIKVAVLTEGSPSCGSSTIYDGSFNKNKINGIGVTTALLREHDIAVFSQHSIPLAQEALLRLDK